MTKKEIVKMISEEVGLTQAKTGEIVQRTLDAIARALADEGRIELRNFGVFEVRKRACRVGRNLKTGEQMTVPARRAVVFKPSKFLERSVGENRCGANQGDDGLPLQLSQEQEPNSTPSQLK